MDSDVVDALIRLGGVAPSATLVAATSWHHVRTAADRGLIVRPRRGVYALPTVDPALAAARGLAGVVSHLSAALAHGWAVKTPPDLPQITVPPGRNVDEHRRVGVRLFRGRVAADGLLTTPVQTVLDCARRLPFDEALAVADSALRRGAVLQQELVDAAERSPRTGRPAALRVARKADARAANPFESVVRALSIDVSGLHLVPQVTIVGVGQVDLCLRLVVECDSFGFHSAREALSSDIERYNRCALQRLALIRFGYDHAMQRPDYVRGCLTDWVAAAGRTTSSSRKRAEHP